MIEMVLPRRPAPEPAAWLAGGGTMGALTRQKDWASTPVGPLADWPQSLKTTVGICLGSRHPMVVWWGREHLTQFYNDAYVSFLGPKHPGALGQSARECWREIWHIIDPMLAGVFATGEATWSEDFLYVIDRNIPREEGYFTFSYSPIRDDSGAIGGIFCACTETTGRVIGERRLRTLRDLSRIDVQADAEHACAAAVKALAENEADIPFALVYLLDERRHRARLVAAAGVQGGDPAAPPTMDVDGETAPWRIGKALREGTTKLQRGVATMFGVVPRGRWPEAPHAALLAPIPAPGQGPATGVLVCGLSPRRVIDADYRSFVNLVAGHIGTSVANARAYAEERKRAEALAEIDRAKTRFFSNISHEFRTPLTLMLGPLEEALGADLPAGERERLDVSHRNAVRLLKLVNTLLDFSRLEAGRADAAYEPTDLAALTAELAGNFHSACASAGLALIVDCPPLPEPVHVDRDMWEKIVLNLVSNAFKFTFTGEIAVRLRETADGAELTVHDTGVGIPAHELPRLFERFHRIEGQRSRTHEGSGIGLALVQELVRLHGGAIRAASEAGHGARFTVTIPFGTAHLPPDRLGARHDGAPTPARADAYVEEALHWLPDAHPRADVAAQPPATNPALRGAHILVAEDNADMRAHVHRLLGPDCEVETAPDGAAALAAMAARRPDLLLADVMMPRLDGFGLLRAVRADPALRDLPVIMLSARAGEESRIEGLSAGADDYLIKPFSARELVARVAATLRLDRLRRAAAQAARESAQTLRRSEAVLAGQKEAFQAAMNGAPLETSLGSLVRTATAQAERELRCAFCIVNPGGTTLRHVTGMPEAYARSIDGLRISPESLSCGLAVATAQPVITPDVREEPRWKPWEWLARDHDFRGCWSFPVETAAGTVVGSLAMYTREPRAPTARERELAAALTHAASIIISRHREAEERQRAEAAQALLLKELNHRVKNTLANVQAIAQHTLRQTKNTAEFVASFAGRIQSLARAHSLLDNTAWRGADLDQLIKNQLLLDPGDGRIDAAGPAVTFEAQTALHLALMLHELRTNAAKYGALAKASGRVTIRWTIDGEALRLAWRETGGGTVAGVSRRGFGTMLIEQSARGEGGSARMLAHDDGIAWEIVLPMSHAASDRSPPDPTEPARDAAPARPHVGPRKRILVVEDEPLIALDVAASLEGLGFEVLGPAASATEALDLIDANQFDGALLDANLAGRPVDDIADVLERRKIPFLFVTGYGRESLPQTFRTSAMLRKPFTSRQLFESIANLAP